MIELDKKLHKDIKEYCQLNGLVMKDFVNKLLKKAFMVEKYGDKPFSSNDVAFAPYVPTLEVTLEEPANLPLITNEKILEKYRKSIEGEYYAIPFDKSWEEKLEENIENGSVIMAPYVLEDSGSPMIVVNHSEKEKMSNLEKEAIEKIKDMVEGQVDLPIEIAEAMEEVDFFELLGEEKNDNTRISITANNENRERVNKTQTTDTSSSTEEKEKIKVVRKKKRKLS